jgi:DNA-binding CsgD family transcriptional regulator
MCSSTAGGSRVSRSAVRRSRLVGRLSERAAIDQLLEAAREGRSGALALCGEPGMGKTALLEYAAERATGMAVAAIAGREAESELAFAGLHDLLTQLQEETTDLAQPARDALNAIFGIGTAAPSLIALGAALLAVFADRGARRPLLCLVDDAQALDRETAQILAFVGRRLSGEGVALILAADTFEGQPFEGMRELRIPSLPDDDARALLEAAAPEGLNEQALAQLLAELNGNPLALLELAGALTPDQLAGRMPLPERLPLGPRLERRLMRRIAGLPPTTRLMLLLVAAEPDASTEVIWSAADDLGIERTALDAAESAGIVEVGRNIRFRYSFMDSAIYRMSSGHDRRRVHSALAAVTRSSLNGDRGTLHRAAASLGPDAEVADELEQAAKAASTRGAFSDAAALLERSAELTPNDESNLTRTVAAAEAELAAGAPLRASTVLDRLGSEFADRPEGAQLQRLRAVIDVELDRNRDGARSLLAAARALEQIDLRQAVETYLEALIAAIHAGTLGRNYSVFWTAKAARERTREPASEITASDFLLDGFATLVLDGHAAAAPLFRRALKLLRETSTPRLLGIGCHAAVELLDDEALYDLVTRRVDVAGRVGRGALASALNYRGGVYEILVGRFDMATADVRHAAEIAATEGDLGFEGRARLSELLAAAWCGREKRARKLARGAIGDATARGQGAELGFAQYALAVLENGLGHYDAAMTAARAACEETACYVTAFALPELIEAAVRSRDIDLATTALRRFEEATSASGTEWSQGMVALSRALLAEPAAAEELHELAIEHMKHSRARPQLARARLMYGEWLRRRRRRSDARAQLTVAYEMLRGMGADAFAGRAQLELVATGGRAPEHKGAVLDALTPHEQRIALLVADGASNPAIAEQLFVSVRTVEYHLHKIFQKLSVGSRTELAHRLLRSSGEPSSPSL